MSTGTLRKLLFLQQNAELGTLKAGLTMQHYRGEKRTYEMLRNAKQVCQLENDAQ